MLTRLLLLLSAGLWTLDAQTAVQSPDGLIEVTVSADGGSLAYSVTYHGKPVILKSGLSLELADQPPLGPHVRILKSQADAADETYTMPYGKSNPIRNVYRSLVVDTQETAAPSRLLTLEIRAYNDGVAFRYRIPRQAGLEEVRLSAEKTDFRLAKDGTTYPLILTGFQTPYEDGYQKTPLSGIHASNLIGLPFLAELPGAAWIAISEANINNYAGMYLQHSGKDAHLLQSRLSPSLEDRGLVVRAPTPLETPWRVILIGAEPGRLIESNLIVNLNLPSQIADTSWIRPGKAAWDWWSGSFAQGVDFKPGMNTATLKHYVDFASKAGLPYLVIDAGWARHCTGENDSGCDLTTTNPEVDLPEILAHAASRNVRIWLWAHWADINQQMDQAFPVFEKWGIAGVKIDFMMRDDQWMVSYYRRVVEKAAAHHLMIDFHGAFKPDGVQRTWPNLITREAVMGLEYSKFTARVTPDHDVMLPFTRMLAGPLDYTPGGWNNVTAADFVPRMLQPMVMGTRAHQIALYVVFESGLQMVSDYPEAYAGQKEFDFVRSVPTTWDETRVLQGHPGDFIAIARRSGKDWYVAALTGSHSNGLDLSLRFIDAGTFTAEIYSDAADAESFPKKTVHQEKSVDRSTMLHVSMVAGGGWVMRLRPLGSVPGAPK